MTLEAVPIPHDEEMLDSLTLGRRIRQLRKDRGMTLDEVGAAIGRAASQVSVLENGKREPRLGDLRSVAKALGVSLEQLLAAEALPRRAQLEIELERAQRGPLFDSLGLAPLHVRKSLSDEAIETIIALHAELDRLHRERAATPEEARRANTELRRQMRTQNNYFPDLEAQARQLLARVEHTGGPLSQRVASDLAAHLGFSLHYVGDLPNSTRSVSDLKHHRIYLKINAGGDPRTVLLQALAGHVLGAKQPKDYRDFLLQRVETNYLAAALMVPEDDAVAFLTEAKDKRELSVEDLRDAFAVSYETAAHRFTNLATQHLGIPRALPQGARVRHDLQGLRERQRRLPHGCPRCRGGAAGVPQMERAPGVRRGGPVQPVPPVHRQAQWHLLVHLQHPGHRSGCVLGQRRHAVQPREVV